MWHIIEKVDHKNGVFKGFYDMSGQNGHPAISDRVHEAPINCTIVFFYLAIKNKVSLKRNFIFVVTVFEEHIQKNGFKKRL